MEIFKEWLQNNGYRFSVEPFGITFKHQGGNFIIGNNTGDNSYLQILMPGVYTLNSHPLKTIFQHKACTDKLYADSFYKVQKNSHSSFEVICCRR